MLSRCQSLLVGVAAFALTVLFIAALPAPLFA